MANKKKTCLNKNLNNWMNNRYGKCSNLKWDVLTVHNLLSRNFYLSILIRLNILHGIPRFVNIQLCKQKSVGTHLSAKTFMLLVVLRRQHRIFKQQDTL